MDNQPIPIQRPSTSATCFEKGNIPHLLGHSPNMVPQLHNLRVSPPPTPSNPHKVSVIDDHKPTVSRYGSLESTLPFPHTSEMDRRPDTQRALSQPHTHKSVGNTRADNRSTGYLPLGVPYDDDQKEDDSNERQVRYLSHPAYPLGHQELLGAPGHYNPSTNAAQDHPKENNLPHQLHHHISPFYHPEKTYYLTPRLTPGYHPLRNRIHTQNDDDTIPRSPGYNDDMSYVDASSTPSMNSQMGGHQVMYHLEDYSVTDNNTMAPQNQQFHQLTLHPVQNDPRHSHHYASAVLYSPNEHPGRGHISSGRQRRWAGGGQHMQANEYLPPQGYIGLAIPQLPSSSYQRGTQEDMEMEASQDIDVYNGGDAIEQEDPMGYDLFASPPRLNEPQFTFPRRHTQYGSSFPSPSYAMGGPRGSDPQQESLATLPPTNRQGSQSNRTPNGPLRTTPSLGATPRRSTMPSPFLVPVEVPSRRVQQGMPLRHNSSMGGGALPRRGGFNFPSPLNISIPQPNLGSSIESPLPAGGSGGTNGSSGQADEPDAWSQREQSVPLTTTHGGVDLNTIPEEHGTHVHEEMKTAK